jgi:hypothetical protein
MKKVLSIAVVATLVISFAACKKEYTCSCEVFGLTVSYDTTASVLKKKEIEDWCNSYDSPLSQCSLK